MTDKIDWQCGATVILLGSNTPNWTNTLAEAIRRAMGMPIEEQSNVAIMTDKDAVPGRPMPLVSIQVPIVRRAVRR
jgi:hypothetical protein